MRVCVCVYIYMNYKERSEIDRCVQKTLGFESEKNENFFHRGGIPRVISRFHWYVCVFVRLKLWLSIISLSLKKKSEYDFVLKVDL